MIVCVFLACNSMLWDIQAERGWFAVVMGFLARYYSFAKFRTFSRSSQVFPDFYLGAPRGWSVNGNERSSFRLPAAFYGLSDKIPDQWGFRKTVRVFAPYGRRIWMMVVHKGLWITFYGGNGGFLWRSFGHFRWGISVRKPNVRDTK